MKKNNAGGLFANKNKGKRFNFEGKNTGTDQLVRGEVVAKDEEEARKKLQRRGIKPLRISKVKATRKRRITQADITVFTRQLATMMKAGLPLMQALARRQSQREFDPVALPLPVLSDLL